MNIIKITHPALSLMLIVASMIGSVGHADDYINGYNLDDGTYVDGHWRTDADDTVRNNYNYYGNSNPYTGTTGSNYYRQNPTSEYYERQPAPDMGPTPNIMGRLGPRTSPTNWSSVGDAFSRADATRSATPNIFSTMQASRQDQLNQQVMYAQIAAQNAAIQAAAEEQQRYQAEQERLQYKSVAENQRINEARQAEFEEARMQATPIKKINNEEFVSMLSFIVEADLKIQDLSAISQQVFESSIINENKLIEPPMMDVAEVLAAQSVDALQSVSSEDPNIQKIISSFILNRTAYRNAIRLRRLAYGNLLASRNPRFLDEVRAEESKISDMNSDPEAVRLMAEYYNSNRALFKDFSSKYPYIAAGMAGETTELLGGTIPANPARMGANLSKLSLAPLVLAVAESGPADKAGIKAGDLIVGVGDNIQINSTIDLDRHMIKLKPGDRMRLILNRKGKKIVVNVRLEKSEEIYKRHKEKSDRAWKTTMAKFFGSN